MYLTTGTPRLVAFTTIHPLLGKRTKAMPDVVQHPTTRFVVVFRLDYIDGRLKKEPI